MHENLINFFHETCSFVLAFQIHNNIFLIFFPFKYSYIYLVKQTQKMKTKNIYFLFTLCYIKQPLYV